MYLALYRYKKKGASIYGSRCLAKQAIMLSNPALLQSFQFSINDMKKRP
jgi:hypothetical protein